jgi:fatty acid desaturase
MLTHSKDWRSVSYLTMLPILVLLQWQHETFNFLLYALTLLFAIGVSSINHNHGHLPLWKNSWMNKVTDYWICLLQGVPVFLFEAVHIKSHHRYNQGQEDVTRVSRVGEHNHLLGYILFPLYVLKPINLLKSEFLKKTRDENFLRYLGILGQHLVLVLLWTITLWINWKKALIYILIPQFIAVHFLLASNYLQHAQAEVGSEFNHSRNFTGFMNTLYFNVGFHTAHHHWDRLHWSELPEAHQNIVNKMNPALNERSWIVYFFKTMTLIPMRDFLKSRLVKG